VPEGLRAICNGALIHKRVFLRGGDRDIGRDRIAIVHEMTGRLVIRKRAAKLLCCPGSGMLGHRHVNNPSTLVLEDEKRLSG
jgi:hypothetical protein